MLEQHILVFWGRKLDDRLWVLIQNQLKWHPPLLIGVHFCVTIVSDQDTPVRDASFYIPTFVGVVVAAVVAEVVNQGGIVSTVLISQLQRNLLQLVLIL
jgi:hypothetical protein